MNRISLVLAAAVLTALVACRGTARRCRPRHVNTCTTNSKNVIGKKVTISRRGNSHPLADGIRRMQDRQEGREQDALAADREAEGLEGFRCTPTVAANNQNHVKYKCVFKGADSPMYVKIGFSLTYKS